jgi:hypothetical protein
MRTVKVTIDNATLLNLFVGAVYGDAKDAIGKDRTFYKAFGSLIGISDVEAVKIANNLARKENHITTKEFRRWLPTVFAEFARVMLETTE